jgi:alpha-tubulin suppressor-like RCC1 family protein
MLRCPRFVVAASPVLLAGCGAILGLDDPKPRPGADGGDASAVPGASDAGTSDAGAAARDPVTDASTGSDAPATLDAAVDVRAPVADAGPDATPSTACDATCAFCDEDKCVRVRSVAAGERHTCAALTDDTTRCWGTNAWGSLGVGTEGDVTFVRPQAVIAFGGADAVYVGKSSSIAHLRSGGYKCWGYNTGFFESETVYSGTPFDCLAIPNLESIGLGWVHGCIVLADAQRTPRCAGLGFGGALGTGIVYTEQAYQEKSYVAVEALTGATQVSAFDTHTCARTESGSAFCWGQNYDGRLGDGTYQVKHAPAQVRDADGKPIKGIESIGAFGQHTCAIRTGGSVACWGDNQQGQLAASASVANSVKPIDIPSLTNIRSLAGGDGFTCALSGTGTVYCWGANQRGQLGLGDGQPAVVRVPTAVLTDVERLTVGVSHACAVTHGALRCWGENAQGQLGDGTKDRRFGPTAVVW